MNSLLNYHLSTPLAAYEGEVSFLGATYYAGVHIYSHLDKYKQPQILNVPITKVELGFKDNVLVSIWLFFKEGYESHLEQALMNLHGKPPTQNQFPAHFRTDDRLRRYWKGSVTFTGIGIRNDDHYYYLTINDFVLPYLTNNH